MQSLFLSLLMTMLIIVIFSYTEHSSRVHRTLLLDPILSQLNPICTLTPCFRYILKLSSHLCLSLSSGDFSSRFRIKCIEHAMFCCNFVGMFSFVETDKLHFKQYVINLTGCIFVVYCYRNFR
jgi:hypothetical protein